MLYVYFIVGFLVVFLVSNIAVSCCGTSLVLAIVIFICDSVLLWYLLAKIFVIACVCFIVLIVLLFVLSLTHVNC